MKRTFLLSACLMVCGMSRGIRADDPPKGDAAGKQFYERLMKEFDKDSDGKLNDEERATARRMTEEFFARVREQSGPPRDGRLEFANPPEFVLKRFDKDGDGKLNEEEQAAARKAREGQPKDSPRGIPNREEMVKRFDKDGDGKLSESEEAAAREAMAKMRNFLPGPGGLPPREELVKRFDKDGDGKLNETEEAAVREAMTKMRGFPNREEMVKRFDKDGDGKLSESEEAAAREAMAKMRNGPPGGFPSREEMVKRFDKDGDGKLSDSEMAAARTEMEKRQRGGAGGPGAGGLTPGEGKPPEAKLNKDVLIKKFDKDGDGKLSDAEQAAAREALQNRDKPK